VDRAEGEFFVTSDGRIVNQEPRVLAALDVILQEDTQLLTVTRTCVGRAIRGHSGAGVGRTSGCQYARSGGRNGARCKGWEPRKARWVPLEITKSIATDNTAQFVNHEVGRLDGLCIVIHMDRATVFKSSSEGGTGSHTKKHAKDMLAFLVEVDGDSQIVSVGGKPVAAVRRGQHFEILERFFENKALLREW